MKKHKIIVILDEITSRQARQLAAEKGMSFREYLVNAMEAGLKKYAKQVDSGGPCMVTLEVSDDTYEVMECYANCFYSEDAAAKHFIMSEVDKEWGNRT